MTRARAGTERLANALMAEYYKQRSSAGFLITEATIISSQANGWNESPGLYTENIRDAWKQVTDAVYAGGVPIFLQRCHRRTWLGKVYWGYTISPVGSVVGFVWALVDALIGGAIFAWLYNFLANRA